eukprot:CAMPEP_0113307522 /NCGR_PEP_ID=MMETSP0010_2-20120614/6333_1 /TAXON_ID=216773 ORGANISM="Corethron hystrix, Strain 308" /NCGR_SAMPLE_ID=MMETSP0010_2 /ASSEMBLY_ACC=CAM_ASM_000155 /LENGTH=236 /DNA_ID=CAMNT_0000162393 /DNA_START=133 /DNA_END=843 /DNA_ORIENTATION=+ /assembly_acc=CAM_ASM_000155
MAAALPVLILLLAPVCFIFLPPVKAFQPQYSLVRNLRSTTSHHLLLLRVHSAFHGHKAIPCLPWMPKNNFKITESHFSLPLIDTAASAAPSPSRRKVLGDSLRCLGFGTAFVTALTVGGVDTTAHASGIEMDVNNMLAREYTAFPGLYPTIGAKIVMGAKNHPYKSKKEVYAAMEGNEAMITRLKTYDSSIVIRPLDKSVRQFKESQICKYECGSRVSSSYRDSQIKSVQSARDGY